MGSVHPERSADAVRAESKGQARLVVIGVRHHSPACARLVRHVIAREKPRFVLIEGPSDMNERLGELALPHALPVALFSWRQDEGKASRGLWSPFCDYSPEWVALEQARASGAQALFMDLPAWHDAFAGDENRYADRVFRASDKIGALAARLGFENVDALWDHLFEGEQPLDALEAALTKYFEMLRGDEPPQERDDAREAFMRGYIAWAMAQGGTTVAVCGGYHSNALKAGWESLPAKRPDAPAPSAARVGSYLVPFSFRRLDAFAGYASGMPSPAWYQRAWEVGVGAVAEDMMGRAVRHLRAKGQRVSAADSIAAHTLMTALTRLRARTEANRVDVLDALAGALVKEALEAPFPWARRGPLPPRTDPLLVELVAAFSGDRVGKLAPGTPQPPLVGDAFAALEAVGLHLEPTEQRATADVSTPAGRARSAVLHQLRLLKIPGIELKRRPDFRRHKTRFHEDWVVRRVLEMDAALIEAAALGGTLLSAVTASLELRAGALADLGTIAQCLIDAALAGITSLEARWLAAIRAGIAVEPSFGVLGSALSKLLLLRRGEIVMSHHGPAELEAVLVAAFERGLWLLEGLEGESAPYDPPSVTAVQALRDTAREPGVTVDLARAQAVCARRARAATAPPAVRGAALGFGWSMGDAAEADVVALVRAAAHPKTFGDFLCGLFALAREVAPRAATLLAAVDAAAVAMPGDDFLIALPALRQAFEHFPPRERLKLAEAVLALSGQQSIDPSTLTRPAVGADVTFAGRQLEQRALERAKRFGLQDGFDA
jgi:hypothetical protein